MGKLLEKFKDLDDMNECFKRNIEVFGFNLQLVTAMEELAELIHAIARIIRFRMTNKILTEKPADEPLNELVDEIADVEFMLGQLMWMYDIKDTVNLIKKVKLKRVTQRTEGIKKQ